MEEKYVNISTQITIYIIEYLHFFSKDNFCNLESDTFFQFVQSLHYSQTEKKKDLPHLIGSLVPVADELCGVQ